jgi:hypothetical protein
MLFEELSDEIIEKIFFSLTVREIVRIEFVCSEWKRISGSGAIWKNNCKKVWKNKCFFKEQIEKDCLELQPFPNYSPLIDGLSVREIKSILIARKKNINGIFEKEDLIDLMNSSTPPHILQCTPLIQSKWKANFVCAYLDSQRCSITKDEVCSIEW